MARARSQPRRRASIAEPFVTLPYALEREAPPFEGNDIKYPESLVRHFLGRCTKPGDKVFDPFAGLGTTLFVAEEMRRVPFGIAGLVSAAALPAAAGMGGRPARALDQSRQR